MSGGSFNYLCDAEPSTHQEELQSMADTLQSMGYTELAEETRSFISPRNPSAELRSVWQAVEWWKSNDWSSRQAHLAAEKYAAKKVQMP